MYDNTEQRRKRRLQEALSPNICSNRLSLDGPAADIVRFGEDNGGGDTAALSFERALPLPLDLDDDEAQCAWDPSTGERREM